MDTPLAGTGVSGSQAGGHVRSGVSTLGIWDWGYTSERAFKHIALETSTTLHKQSILAS